MVIKSKLLDGIRYWLQHLVLWISSISNALCADKGEHNENDDNVQMSEGEIYADA